METETDPNSIPCFEQATHQGKLLTAVFQELRADLATVSQPALVYDAICEGLLQNPRIYDKEWCGRFDASPLIPPLGSSAGLAEAHACMGFNAFNKSLHKAHLDVLCMVDLFELAVRKFARALLVLAKRLRRPQC